MEGPCAQPQAAGSRAGTYLTPQCAAVTTQFSLISDPPQKWKPLLRWWGELPSAPGTAGTTAGVLCAWPLTQHPPQPPAGTHLEGHLPWPGSWYRWLPVDDAVVATDDGCNGGHAAACRAQAAVEQRLQPSQPHVPPIPSPFQAPCLPAEPRGSTYSPGRGWHGQSPPAPGSSAATAEPLLLVGTDPAWGSAPLIPTIDLAATALGDSMAAGTVPG